MQTLFENFLDYCDQDNRELTVSIKTWLADYFDLRCRLIPLNQEEIDWINLNLTDEMQLEILGMKADNFNEYFESCAKNDGLGENNESH